jgi:hypothetical protein
MTNYIIKKNAERLINYIDMIKTAENLIERQKIDLNKWQPNGFGGLREHYQKRININLEIIAYLQKRINNILNNLNK